jgi:hypothetical protein
VTATDLLIPGAPQTIVRLNNPTKPLIAPKRIASRGYEIDDAPPGLQRQIFIRQSLPYFLKECL